MLANVRGRVRNTFLAKSQALLPLLESVVNAIDAIEDSGRDSSQGHIEIRILRHKSQSVMFGENEPSMYPISGFEVTDDGIGFTDANYTAFNEADTRSKENRGGKGIGRFLWLKAFKKVEISSIFRQNDQLVRRQFVFSLDTADGISNHVVEPVSEEKPSGTTVRLIGFDKDFERLVDHNPRLLAQRIVEHCFEYFILTRMPEVVLVDDEKTSIKLWDLYDGLVAGKRPERLEIKGIEFDIAHFQLRAHSDLKHQLCYCADRRVVETAKLASKIPNLTTTLTDPEGESFVYAGYVSSPYLDSKVNSQRDAFDIPDNGEFMFPGELSRREIESEVCAASRRALEPYTEGIRKEKQDRVREYVNNDAPEYRFIINSHSDCLDQIPPEPSDEIIESHLHDIRRQIEKDLRQQGEQVQTDVFDGSAELSDERLERFATWWNEYNELGKSELAKYIVHRKNILELLDRALRRQETGKYSLEELIHKMIFPLRKTSDDVSYDQHNLWVIDEKLAYHEYLASDLSLSQVERLESDSSQRPDLLFFFDRAIAIVDTDLPSVSSVVLFEFKRPMRDDYGANENPIQQVLKYVEAIRGGKAKTKDGRPFDIPPKTPFYCYIICDLTPHLREQARFSDLRSTPDNCGYFGYNSEVEAYVEVIGFTKFVGDAKKRNRVLFEKLHLPPKLSVD